MYGSFSETALKDFYDFTRCVRPNGTVYGTGGKCRKGVEQKADNKDSRKERRDKILAQIGHHKDSRPDTLKKNIDTLSNLVKNEPGFRSPLTESTLKALRFLRLKDHLDSSKAKKEGEASLETEMRELLKNSPKYSETPGSKNPLPRLMTQEEEVKRLGEELETVKSKIRALGEPKSDNDRAKLALLQKEGMSLGRNLSNAKKGSTVVPELSSVYSRQGYNARPQVVAKASDLETMPGLMNTPDGKRIIAYRGVTNAEFAFQFKGGRARRGSSLPRQRGFWQWFLRGFITC